MTIFWTKDDALKYIKETNELIELYGFDELDSDTLERRNYAFAVLAAHE